MTPSFNNLGWMYGQTNGQTDGVHSDNLGWVIKDLKNGQTSLSERHMWKKLKHFLGTFLEMGTYFCIRNVLKLHRKKVLEDLKKLCSQN